MIKNFDVGEIVADYLATHSFDGLYNHDAECACKLDDLNPCGNIGMDCIAGHYLESNCPEHDFHIGNKTDPNNLPVYKCNT